MSNHRKARGCQVDECSRPHCARGRCKSHYNRAVKDGLITPEPKIVRTYSAAHSKVRRVRGSATERQCHACGKPADQWAYNHRDPAELVEAAGTHAGIAFSASPGFYLPLCMSCHHYFDRTERKATDAQSVA